MKYYILRQTVNFLSKTALILIIFITSFLSQSNAQDQGDFSISSEIPSNGEVINDSQPSADDLRISQLESEMKNAIERGDNPTSSRIANEIRSIREVNEIHSIPDNDTKFIPAGDAEVSDFAAGMPPVTNGEVNFTSQSDHRQIDMKMGEDGNIYVALIRAQNGFTWRGRIDVYRSSNAGKSWISCGAFYSMTKYYNNISMLVESRNNSVPDSSRIIIFFTVDDNGSNDYSSLYFATFRRDGSGHFSGLIANPQSAYSIYSVSAVSDGAFFSSATYFGVVAIEKDPTGSNFPRTKFFRTANWGASWISATFNTNYHDYYPSAQFKNGSVDELMFAVERRLSATEWQIRVIRSAWSVSSSFTTEVLTSGSYKYEKPCMAIKQNDPADSLIITCTRNGLGVYHSSTNAGDSWIVNLSLNQSWNNRFTWCSSTPNGTAPFTAVFVSQDGDSVGVRRGVPGAMGNTTYKVNSHPASTLVNPVCVTRPGTQSNFAVIAYAGEDEEYVYSENEGHKFLDLMATLEGYYNPDANNMNNDDVVKVYLKSNTSPYSTIDSAAGAFNPSTLQVEYAYPNMPQLVFSEVQHNKNYYVVLKHRNSIETWSSITVSSQPDTMSYDFVNGINKAYGNNMKIVDMNPLRCGIYGGDVNQDGTIDLTDIVNVFNDANNFQSGYVVTDISGDNFVDLSDLAITFNNANAFISVVRP